MPRAPLTAHRPALAAALAVGLCAAALLACSYTHRPDLHQGEPSQFELVSSLPAPATVGVLRAAPIDLWFSAAPDPDTVADLDVRVFSGLIEAPGAVRVDLLEHRLRMQPYNSLRPELRHEVYLAAAVRGLNGAKLSRSIVFDFTTGQEEGIRSQPQMVSADELQPLWSQRCASCHSGVEPPMAVNVSSPDAIRSSMRAVPSSSGLLLIKPGDHARSYLVRKLLDEGGYLGSPMPPDGTHLSGVELRRVADWIDSGAP